MKDLKDPKATKINPTTKQTAEEKKKRKKLVRIANFLLTKHRKTS